jgi:hypothetical protein
MVTTSIKNVKMHLPMHRIRREHSPVLIQSKHSKNAVNDNSGSYALCMYTIAWGHAYPNSTVRASRLLYPSDRSIVLRVERTSNKISSKLGC